MKQEQAELSARRIALVEAEKRAETLFDEIEQRNLVRAGRTEREIEQEIYQIALDQFGVEKHWHKRIVRAGPNTLTLAADNPPVRDIETDDIVYVDLGPVFEDWEADLGRTYVLGEDPVKHRLAADLPVIFDAGRRYFTEHPDITGAQLHAEIDRLARGAGWELGGTGFAGHLVGEFPHEIMDADRVQSYIAPGSITPMRGTDRAGRTCHWILEIHLVDKARTFGGFYERLL